ncbi:MAG: SDR family NAD(P)-dependent oxidoreductase [Ignavibacteria bacterium]|nr:SDR family NAD(P)-dependent oxidoreductase [Ignavibacteria bacterium]
MNFKNQTAIISGATGALGSVLARHFASLGARVAVPVSSQTSLQKIAALGIPEEQLFAAPADLTLEGPTETFVEQAVQKFGSINILVNAAGGYAGGKEVASTGLSDLEGMLSINLKTVYNLTRLVLPRMKAAGYGRIVSIASMPAVTPSAGSGPYAIAKRGVITLTETIAQEVKGNGVTANAIAISILDTDANRTAMPSADHSKWVSTGEVALLVAMVCSRELPSMSGNTIRVYGNV